MTKLEQRIVELYLKREGLKRENFDTQGEWEDITDWIEDFAQALASMIKETKPRELTEYDIGLTTSHEERNEKISGIRIYNRALTDWSERMGI